MFNISVIVPTLDRYQQLGNLLDGISHWPTQPDEIIIIDQTPFVMGPGNYPDLSDSQRCIQHIRADFRGPCKARNTGARLAQGDLLWFLDDDMAPDTEIDLVAYIRSHFEEYAHSVLTATHTFNPMSLQMHRRFDVLRHLTLNWNTFVDEYRFSLGLLGGNVVVPRSVFFELNGFDEQFDPDGAFEDRDFGLRCFYRGIMVFQSQRLYLRHLQAMSGGRRADPQQANLTCFWSKYMSEDMYYIQIFAHWLSQTRWSLCRRLVRHFARGILRAPSYRSLVLKKDQPSENG